jgi:alkylation response protein AidB-like acyl-CoA dehydrogenase
MRPEPRMTHALDRGTRLLDGIRDLAPAIEAGALEMERARRIPTALLEQLRSLGVFRMLVPRSHGGYAFPYPLSIEVLIETAAADGSTGWTVMIGSHAPLMFSQLPQTTFDEIYSRGPDVIIAGSSSPRGTLERVNDDYRASGRWNFATGCQHADWMFGVCRQAREQDPAKESQDAESLHFVVLPAAQWEVVDTWHTAGLRGTGSHDITLPSTLVNAEHTSQIRRDGSSNSPERELMFSAEQKIMHVAAVSVGIATGALRDLTSLAKTGKRRVYTADSLADTPLFQHRLGHAEADVHSARAYLRELAQEFWTDLQRSSVHPLFITRALQASAWIVETCTRAVDACYQAAGGVAVYESSPLQRRLRDIHTLSQHVLVQEGYFTAAGAVRLERRHAMPFARS